MRYVAVMVMLAGSVVAAHAEPVPVVIDAYGRTVGPLIAPGSVAMTVQGRVYRIAFSVNGFVVDAPRMLNFESTDCSGTAYLEDSLSPPIAYVGANPLEPGYVLSAPDEALTPRPISSSRNGADPQAPCNAVFGPGPGPNPVPVPMTRSVAPILTLPWLPGFVAPFKVQLR